MFICYAINMSPKKHHRHGPPYFGLFVRIFKALAEGNRLHILHVIGDGELTVSQIARSVDISQPLVSHHLRALREAGILRTRRDGPFVYHSLADSRLLQHLESWNDVVGAARTAALEEHDTMELPRWSIPKLETESQPLRSRGGDHRRRRIEQ